MFKKNLFSDWRYYKKGIVALVMLFPLNTAAQELGGFPPSFKFQYIDTDTVRVIFPKGLEKQASRIASVVTYESRNNRVSIGSKDLKLRIVLQNQTVISNGYVALAPFRSEFYATPQQESASLGSLPWLDLLAIHEYRHALQYMNSRNGASKVLYWIGGESAWALGVNLSVPNWFFEGDAVINETVLSPQGRGRLPKFFLPYRSLALSSKSYSYAKARNGSLKDYVPDHYKLGFLMCVHGRNKYGNEYWKNVFSDASAYRYVFYPFSKAMKHHSSDQKNVKHFYEDMIVGNYQKWKNENDTIIITEAALINKVEKNNLYTSYRYPHYVNENEIIALKASYQKIAAFYLIDKEGKESRITTQGYTSDPYYSYRNGKIIWTELNFHKRWDWYDYSVVKLYDIEIGKKIQLTHRTKYFSPDLSPDLTKIVAVEVLPSSVCNFHILDSKTGKILKILPNKNVHYLTYPKFSTDGKFIVSAVRNQQGEMALLRQNIQTEDIEYLTPFSNNVLGVCSPADDHVYFEASYSGIDNIYAVRPGNTTIYRVTSRVLGSFQPSFSTSQNALLFSEFSSLGEDVYQIKIDTADWKIINPLPLDQQSKFEFIGTKEEGGNILDQISTQNYTIKTYPKHKNILNIHSWYPYLIDPNYGISIQSDNILNTLSLSVGGYYNRNENLFNYSFDAIYGGLYPQLKLGYQRNLGRNNKWNEQEFYWNENVYAAGFALPLNYTRGIFQRSLQFKFNYNFIQADYVAFRNKTISMDYVDPNIRLNLNSLKSGLVLINRRKQAVQNIYPSFGQYFEANYNRALESKTASQIHLIGEFSFPSIFKNHHIVMQSEFVSESSRNLYQYVDNFFYARGYTATSYNKMVKVGFNYHFPIFYPDLGLAGIIYFLRVRANLFYDYSIANRDFKNEHYSNTNEYSSAGAEIIFDTKIFNAAGVSFGVRYINLLNINPQTPKVNSTVEFFIPVKRL